MMNFRKISAASKGLLILRYFTENKPEATAETAATAGAGVDPAGRDLETGGRMTAYYTGQDGRAMWRPDMPQMLADVIGVDAKRPPRDKELSRLFEGRRGDNGEAWSQHNRKLSGFDIVFSPDKSVSLAAAFAPTDAERAMIRNATDRAADRAMRFLASEIGWARKGDGGKDGADPGAVGWISFRHHTARPTMQVQDGPGGETYLFDAPVAGDPHDHIHNFLMNVVVTAEGRVGSLDTRVLTDAKIKMIGAYFQVYLAEELKRLGIEIAVGADHQAVAITAIPEAAKEAFSKRDNQILRKAKAFAKEQGLDWEEMSAEKKLDIMEEASAEGRLGKMQVDQDRIWRDQAEKLGWKHTSVLDKVEHAELSQEDRFERAFRFAAKEIAKEFDTAAVIDHDKLGMYAARGLIGLGAQGGPSDIARIVDLIEERGIQLKGEHVALIVGHSGEKVRVTNSAQVRIEERLGELAKRAVHDKTAALSVDAISTAIARSGFTFTHEQRAAIHAFAEGGALTMLTGVAGAGKTTLLEPLVDAWKADRRFSQGGREVIGAAMAWRQADALQDAGIDKTYAIATLLTEIESGKFQPSRNTVLVLDEVSQIGPRSMLKLLELQAKTGMTIKMLGDRDQAQAIEAGDSIELLRRVLPPEALPGLMTTMRQSTRRGREVAGLFREGNAQLALDMKRADGHAMMVGGDRDQVVARIADLYIARRDHLLASGSRRGVTVSAPTNDDVAEISQAIRERLKRRGEIGGQEKSYPAIDQRGQHYDLSIATGDRVRLFRRVWGHVNGQGRDVGNNGDVLEVLAQDATHLRVMNKRGEIADIEWRRLRDEKTGRLLLGFGHALTIDAAQGLTSDEHINALPRGTAGVTAFTTYVAESRSRGASWTVISEGALLEAERHRQAMGDITPITKEKLWKRAAEDMSEKPYKALGIDLLAEAIHDRESAIDAFMKTHQTMEAAVQADPAIGKKAFSRLRAAAVNDTLGRHLSALDSAIAANANLSRDTAKGAEAAAHLAKLRADARAAAGRMEQIAPSERPQSSPSVSF
ncbi:relaxase domain-containing protein [Acidisoma silvae]|uniref:Relaxase domain-containing protein n=2 Tax=Acidisoma silvae TaxID=2802396 RepID=A0A964E0R8_9PROT|nr:relaxase domain-containing protein [Acidisoma silvae]